MQRRKNYFIKKKFQMKFLSGFVILLLLESVLVAGLFMHVSSNTLTTGYANSVLKIERTADFFLVSYTIIIFIVAVGLAMVGLLIFILLSHRLAGPLYRFERTLMDISSGDLTSRVSLRKTDQITEMKDALNELIAALDKRMARIKNNFLELEELLAKKEELKSSAKITHLVDALKQDIEHFKVSSIKE